MISIKSEKEIQIMAENGKKLAQIMNRLKQEVRSGIKTKELNRLAESLILKLGGKPSFKNYEGFPTGLCVSINEEIVHGVPSERVLKEGDVVSLDLGFFNRGFHSDMAVTVPVRETSPESQRLIRITKKCLKLGINKSRPGNTFGDIGNAVQRYAESQGFNVVRELCGHGIGRQLHQEPQILNYGKQHTGDKIKPGMVFCIEPMLTMGDWRIEKGENGFVYVTADGSLSAHFEHTIAITKYGPTILTKI